MARAREILFPLVGIDRRSERVPGIRGSPGRVKHLREMDEGVCLEIEELGRSE